MTRWLLATAEALGVLGLLALAWVIATALLVGLP